MGATYVGIGFCGKIVFHLIQLMLQQQQQHSQMIQHLKL